MTCCCSLLPCKAVVLSYRVVTVPEESLEVLRQLGAPCVAGVHRDEDAHGGSQVDLLSHKVEPVLLVSYGVLVCT